MGAPDASTGGAVIGLGWDYTCVRLADPCDVRCFGQNTTGQLGDGSTTNRTTPTSVVW